MNKTPKFKETGWQFKASFTLLPAGSFLDILAKGNAFKAHTSYAYVASLRAPASQELRSHTILGAVEIRQEAHPMGTAAHLRPSEEDVSG